MTLHTNSSLSLRMRLMALALGLLAAVGASHRGSGLFIRRAALWFICLIFLLSAGGMVMPFEPPGVSRASTVKLTDLEQGSEPAAL